MSIKSKGIELNLMTFLMISGIVLLVISAKYLSRNTFADIPYEPENLSAVEKNGEVLLDWEIPTWDGGVVITDYVIEYKESGSDSWSVFIDNTSSETFATVSGLTNGVSYDFKVYAVNQDGSGDYSSPVTAVPASWYNSD